MNSYLRDITIIGVNSNSPLERVLQIESAYNIKYLIRLTDNSLGFLEYKDDGFLTPVPNFQIVSLRLFIQYYKIRTKIGNPITNWLTLTDNDLDQFNVMAPDTVTTVLPSGLSTYPPPNTNPYLQDFDRGFKCDPNVPQVISNKRNWTDWKEHTIASINSQHAEDIINPLFLLLGHSCTFPCYAKLCLSDMYH